jgi:hypothetical protein
MNNTKTLAIVAVLTAATLVVAGTFAATTPAAFAYQKKKQEDKNAAVKCKAVGDSDLICQSIDQQATIDQQQTVNGDGSSATATGTITQSASNTATISR